MTKNVNERIDVGRDYPLNEDMLTPSRLICNEDAHRINDGGPVQAVNEIMAKVDDDMSGLKIMNRLMLEELKNNEVEL